MAELDTQIVDTIHKAQANGSAILGAKVTLKKLRAGTLAKIFLASNVAEVLEEDITYYAGLNGTEVVKLPALAEDISIVCKKPFFITVIGIAK